VLFIQGVRGRQSIVPLQALWSVEVERERQRPNCGSCSAAMAKTKLIPSKSWLYRLVQPWALDSARLLAWGFSAVISRG